MPQWSAGGVGVIQLPSGRTVRGRRIDNVEEGAASEFTLLLALRRPADLPKRAVWIAWPDFGIPLDRQAASQQLHEAWARSDFQRVEVACRGGRGRTGTALACIAVLDGMQTDDAIALVRRQYDRRAIEVPWQRWYAATFNPSPID